MKEKDKERYKEAADNLGGSNPYYISSQERYGLDRGNRDGGFVRFDDGNRRDDPSRRDNPYNNNRDPRVIQLKICPLNHISFQNY